MAYFVETEEFDSETLNILGNALDGAWLRVKMAAPWRKVRHRSLRAQWRSRL
jgi:hypothetical protein